MGVLRWFPQLFDYVKIIYVFSSSGFFLYVLNGDTLNAQPLEAGGNTDLDDIAYFLM